MDLKLCLDGPYGLTARSPLLLFTQAPAAGSSGIYLQVVQLERVYRVAYIGETGATFSLRLCSENASWLCGSDRRSGQTKDLAPDLYCHGIRCYVTPPDDAVVRRCWREQILDDTLIFFGALDVDQAHRRTVEAALIRRLKGCSPAVSKFLYNKPMGSRSFGGTLTVAVPEGVVVEGLEECFSDSF